MSGGKNGPGITDGIALEDLHQQHRDSEENDVADDTVGDVPTNPIREDSEIEEADSELGGAEHELVDQPHRVRED